MAATQIAGRALSIGLAIIESDPRHVFPGQSQPSATHASQSAAAVSNAQPEPTAEHAQPCAASLSTDPPRAALASPPPPAAAQPSSPTPRFVSTADAARELGYRKPSALVQHCQRHPAILKLSRKEGRCRLWDVAKLRDEYQRQGWQPK